jgi:hypothetical protein
MEQNRHHLNETIPIENNLSLPLDTDTNTQIQKIADNMQSMLKESCFDLKPLVNPHYIYVRASARSKHYLLNKNIACQEKNRKPPLKPFNINTLMNNNKATFNQKSEPAVRTKELYGKEESVKIHTFNDYLPMAISVKDFTELYVPKTIQYMWTGNNLDYDNAMTLKQNLNTYLSLSTVEQAIYMSSITDIRHVTEDDLKNDACDIELLGHRGVFAKKDIPEMSIIGVYTGIFIADAIDMMKLSEKMSLTHLQDYLFRIPLTDKFPKITGYQYGNRLSLINAASNYKSDDQTTFDQLCRRSNIMLVAAKSNECPIPKIANNENCPDVLFFIAGCHIPAGTQLLYDYGNVYW